MAEVARRAGVSPWLVRQEPLLEQVRTAQKWVSTTTPGPVERACADGGSQQVERDLLREENHRLRQETTRLKQPLSAVLGDRIDGTDAITQTRRADELATRNGILAQHSAETLGKLREFEQASTELASELAAAHTVNRALMAELNRAKPLQT